MPDSGKRSDWLTAIKLLEKERTLLILGYY